MSPRFLSRGIAVLAGTGDPAAMKEQDTMRYTNGFWLTLAILMNAGLPRMAAQVEPKAGAWKTWVLTSGSQLRLPPPPDETATRAETEQLRQMESRRDTAMLDRLNF